MHPTEQDPSTHPKRLYLAPPPNLCSRLLQVMYHLYVTQATTSPTLRTSEATSDPGMTLELHLHGLHQKTSSVLWLQHHPGHCRPTIKTKHLHPDTRHHHLHQISQTLRHSCLFQTRSSLTHHIQLQLQVSVLLLLDTR